MIKKGIIGIIVVILGLGLWYLGIKTYDYEITFKGNLSSIGACHFIKNHEARIHGKQLNFTKDSTLTQLQYRRKIGDKPYTMHWCFERMGDTLTQCTLGITAEKSAVWNRIKILLGAETEIPVIKEEMITLREQLYNFTDSFRVQIEGVDTIPETESYAVTIKADRIHKAKAMMRNNTQLSSWIKQQEIQPRGYPYVRIKQWDMQTDKMTFEYGFPLPSENQTNTSIRHPAIHHTTVVPQQAIKATYYGNYMHSDQAWFAILAYAKNKGLSLATTPIEFFYDNPIEGGDDRKWKAEIFMPILKK